MQKKQISDTRIAFGQFLAASSKKNRAGQSDFAQLAKVERLQNVEKKADKNTILGRFFFFIFGQAEAASCAEK